MAPGIDDHDAIEALFARFAGAVASGDEAAFTALCVADVSPQLEVFRNNRGAQLRIRAIEQTGDVAVVRFDAADDAGELTVSRESAGWRIRGL